VHVNNLNVTAVDGGLQPGSLQHVGINFICIESRILKYVFDMSDARIKDEEEAEPATEAPLRLLRMQTLPCGAWS
jgi:hypothetical protein